MPAAITTQTHKHTHTDMNTQTHIQLYIQISQSKLVNILFNRQSGKSSYDDFKPSALKPEKHSPFLTFLTSHLPIAAHLPTIQSSPPPPADSIPFFLRSRPITAGRVVKGLATAQSDGLLQLPSPRLTGEQIRHKGTRAHLTGETT